MYVGGFFEIKKSNQFEPARATSSDGRRWWRSAVTSSKRIDRRRRMLYGQWCVQRRCIVRILWFEKERERWVFLVQDNIECYCCIQTFDVFNVTLAARLFLREFLCIAMKSNSFWVNFSSFGKQQLISLLEEVEIEATTAAVDEALFDADDDEPPDIVRSRLPIELPPLAFIDATWWWCDCCCCCCWCTIVESVDWSALSTRKFSVRPFLFVFDYWCFCNNFFFSIGLFYQYLSSSGTCDSRIRMQW